MEMTLETMGDVKRMGKVARKIFFTVKIANREVALPLEKGAFLREIKPLSSDMKLAGTFDGQDLTIA